MSKLVSFTDEQIEGLSGLGIATIYIEVGDGGSVHREIGLDSVGEIVHRHPGLPTVAPYGLFDLQSVEIDPRSDGEIPFDHFEVLCVG